MIMLYEHDDLIIEHQQNWIVQIKKIKKQYQSKIINYSIVIGQRMSKTLIRLSQQKISSRQPHCQVSSFQKLIKNGQPSKYDQRPQSRYSCITDHSSLAVYKKKEMKEFVKTFRTNQQKYQFLLKSPVSQSKANIVSDQSFLLPERNQHTQTNEQREGSDPQVRNKNILEEYEKRIQELIKEKLLKKSHSKTMFSSRVQQDQIQKELNRIVEQLKQLSCKMDDDDSQELLLIQLREIDQRIMIYEKIIAESFTQSEMLKRFYYARKCLKHNGTNRTQLSKLHKSCDSIGKYKNQNCSFPQTQIINFRTNNQLSFIKPKRQDYQLTKNCNKQNKYVPKRQAFPKSSYQEEFRNYGILPTYKHRKSENYINFPLDENKISTYHSDFNQKTVSKFDSKMLDCRQDKIKAGKIPFMGKQYSKAPQNQIYKIKKNKITQSPKFESSPLSPNENMRKSEYSCSHKNKTEYHWNFQGSKPSITSFIKNKNLSNLKMSYKRQARV